MRIDVTNQQQQSNTNATTQDVDFYQNPTPLIYLVSGVSKKGNAYTALKIEVGDYSALLFPSRFELKYLQTVLPFNSNN